MANPQLQGKNQFGEEIVYTLLNTPASLQSLATGLPAKAGITSLSALTSPVAAITVTTAGGNTYTDAAINTALASAVADLQTQLTQMNAILAALKATT